MSDEHPLPREHQERDNIREQKTVREQAVLTP
jgi:hypothetical protein